MDDAFTVNLDTHLPAQLFRVHSKLSRHAETESARACDLDIHEWRALQIIAFDGPATADGVADRLAMDRPATRRALSRLEMKGLVMSEPVTAGCAAVTRLTPSGRALQDEVAKFSNKREARLTRTFSRQDRERLLHLLQVLDSEIDAILAGRWCARAAG